MWSFLSFFPLLLLLTQPFNQSINQSIHLSVYLMYLYSIWLSVCLSVDLSLERQGTLKWECWGRNDWKAKSFKKVKLMLNWGFANSRNTSICYSVTKASSSTAEWLHTDEKKHGKYAALSSPSPLLSGDEIRCLITLKLPHIVTLLRTEHSVVNWTFRRLFHRSHFVTVLLCDLDEVSV